MDREVLLKEKNKTTTKEKNKTTTKETKIPLVLLYNKLLPNISKIVRKYWSCL